MSTQWSPATATLPVFENEIRGEVIGPDDDLYDAARALWNGAHDGRPALIVRCADTEDVRSAVRFARAEDLELAVRGGGHSIPGYSTVDGGLVVDLSSMKGIDVDPDRAIASVGGGVLWRELDAATQEYGLATTGGLVSSTGVAGFTLGGGIGWLMRKHGLACDNLRGAEVVTADGEVLTASEGENPELFWGLRGGGGNFGIVTRFEFDLHPVGPTVAAGPVFYPGDRAEELLQFYRDYVRGLGDETTTLINLLTAPPAPFIPEKWHGRKIVAFIGVHAGDLEEGMDALFPLRDLGDPIADLIGPMPYVGMQGLIDDLWAPGTKAYMKAGYLRALDDPSINALASLHREAPGASEIHVQHFGGAVAEVPDGDTSYGERRAEFVLNACAVSHEPGGIAEHVNWAQRVYGAVEPSLTGGAYVNFLSAEGEDRVRAAYGAAKFARLQALKDQYDPDNVFHRNQNIPPTGDR
jgi:FAD/FMN-containing dehydrogenase